MPTTTYTVLDGEIISENRNGAESDYIADPLGSTVALLDSSQTITDTFAYWPYGEERSRTGTTPTPFRFVGTLGYYRDSATRTYVRARNYLEGHGRWLTLDRAGYEETLNLYEYVGGNPPSRVDPTGFGIIWFGCNEDNRDAIKEGYQYALWAQELSGFSGVHRVMRAWRDWEEVP